MADITRHIGSMASSGSRVIVVFREIPDNINRCLVVFGDAMPESMRDAVSDVVNHAGQNTKDLYEAFHREQMPNGENMLSALHKYGLLVSQLTSDVLMHPTRNYSIKLDELNEQLRLQEDPTTTVNESDLQKKFNPYQEKVEHLDEKDSQNIAANLMLAADDLESEATRKREQAFGMRPEMREKFESTLKATVVAPVVDLSDDSGSKFSLELAGISQRKATEALKDAWAIANPSKVKAKS